MIVRPRPKVYELFFIVRGSIIKDVYQLILATGLLSLFIVFLRVFHVGMLPDFANAPFALIGTALSIFLGFRNNACYDRWWEARKQWGQLVYAARHFSKTTMLVEARCPDDDKGSEERRSLVRLVIAFCQAMVPYLRTSDHHEKVRPYLSDEEFAAYRASRNPPDWITTRLQRELVRLNASGVLSDIHFQTLDRSVAEMTLAQASCERIRSTPVPFGYTLLLHRTAHLFCFMLPFGLADVMGWYTPLLSMLIAYAFFGLDALGDELETPSSTRSNALPIGAIADTIEINLRESLGEKDLPPLPAPVDFLLL